MSRRKNGHFKCEKYSAHRPSSIALRDFHNLRILRVLLCASVPDLCDAWRVVTIWLSGDVVIGYINSTSFWISTEMTVRGPVSVYLGI